MTNNVEIIHARRSNNMYREWLITQVLHGYDHRFMLRQLYEKEFVWLIPNDDNRIADGWELRIRCAEKYSEVNRDELVPYGTVLEVLVALSYRLQFQTSHVSAQHWAWNLVKNLELDRFEGKTTPEHRVIIDGILEQLIWRLYDTNGVGGFFPLAWPQQDQTKVEIWYQMAAYLNEQFEM